MKYEGDERRTPQRWRFDKTVSLADVLSFISAALAVVYAYTTLDKRVAVLEDFRAEQKEAAKSKDQDQARYQARIDTQLQSLNEKLDRLILVMRR